MNILVVPYTSSHGWNYRCLLPRHLGSDLWRHESTTSSKLQSIQVCCPTRVTHFSAHLADNQKFNSGFMHLAAGLSVGLSGLAAGYVIGIVGDMV